MHWRAQECVSAQCVGTVTCHGGWMALGWLNMCAVTVVRDIPKSSWQDIQVQVVQCLGSRRETWRDSQSDFAGCSESQAHWQRSGGRSLSITRDQAFEAAAERY